MVRPRLAAAKKQANNTSARSDNRYEKSYNKVFSVLTSVYTVAPAGI
jgi:hypothetical protein